MIANNRNWKDHEFVFVIGGIPMLVGPLERGFNRVFCLISTDDKYSSINKR